MARLLAHAHDLTGVELYLCKAFDTHWSFAERAQREPLFYEDELLNKLVEKCVLLVSERICAEIEPQLESLVAGIKFLQDHQFEQYPISKLRDFVELEEKVDDIRTIMRSKKLEALYELRSRIREIVGELSRALSAVTKEYCRRLGDAREWLVQGTARLTEAEKSEKFAVIRKEASLVGVPIIALVLLLFFIGAGLEVYGTLFLIGLIVTVLVVFNASSVFGEQVRDRRRTAFDDRLTALYAGISRLAPQTIAGRTMIESSKQEKSITR